MSVRNMCFDKVLPHELNRPARTFTVAGRLRAVFEFRKRWITGSTLSVRFMGGTQSQHELVMEQCLDCPRCETGNHKGFRHNI